MRTVSDDDWLEKTREYWDEYILNEDGSPNMQQIYAELHDYKHVAGEAMTVYSSVTCDQMSKASYYAVDVIRVATECQDEAIAEAVRDVLDDIDDGVTTDELRNEYPDPYTGRVEREQR